MRHKITTVRMFLKLYFPLPHVYILFLLALFFPWVNTVKLSTISAEDANKLNQEMTPNYYFFTVICLQKITFLPIVE